MSANAADDNMSWNPRPPSEGAIGEPTAGVTDSAARFLDHFNQIVMMIELIGRLPDLAEDVRIWRPRSLVEHSREAGAAIAGYDALSPVARHAFDAVVAGLNTLGLAAVALCENAGGRLTPDEIAACREIGVVMGSLLERARALIETAEDPRSGAAKAPADRTSVQERAG